MAPQTYGARFLQAFRRLGGSTKQWFPSVIDSLAADRNAFISLVATGRTLIDKELSTAANVHEPEALATRVFDRMEKPTTARGGHGTVYCRSCRGDRPRPGEGRQDNRRAEMRLNDYAKDESPRPTPAT